MKNLGIGTLVLAGLLTVLIFAMQGCDIGDAVRVDVPRGVRQELQTTGSPLPPRVTYNDSLEAWEEWLVHVQAESARLQRETERFAEEIDDSAQVVAAITSFGNDALSMSLPLLGTLPMGTLAVAGVTLAGGLLLPPPGQRKREDELWDEAYAAGRDGIEEGVALAARKEGV